MARASTFSATLGFFSAARQGRRDDAELGKGLWRRAHDRFNRGLDRYHQVPEGVEDEALYGELVEIANQLSALAPRVRQWIGHPGAAGRGPPRPVDGGQLPGHDG